MSAEIVTAEELAFREYLKEKLAEHYKYWKSYKTSTLSPVIATVVDLKTVRRWAGLEGKSISTFPKRTITWDEFLAKVQFGDDDNTVKARLNELLQAAEKASNGVQTSSLKRYEMSTQNIRIVIPPPIDFDGREDDLLAMKQRLGLFKHPAHLQTAIFGWPGVGKTSFVAKLAHDEDISKHFAKRVFYISLGPENETSSHAIQVKGLKALCTIMGLDEDEDDEAENPLESMVLAISSVLIGKKALLIVDDPYTSTALAPFQAIAQKSEACLVIATRVREVAEALTGLEEDIFELKILDPISAFDLFKRYAPIVSERFSREIQGEEKEGIWTNGLLPSIEYLPLAIRVAAPLLEKELRQGFDPLLIIQSIHAELLKSPRPSLFERETGKIPSVNETLKWSTKRLLENDPESHRCFADLGDEIIQEKPASLTFGLLQKSWRVSDPKRVLKVLIDMGLLHVLQDKGSPYYWIHALLKAHASALLEEYYA